MSWDAFVLVLGFLGASVVILAYCLVARHRPDDRGPRRRGRKNRSET